LVRYEVRAKEAGFSFALVSNQMALCWAKTEDEAKKIAKEWWAVAAKINVSFGDG